ncbi:MAG: asparagine synthase (glutamine-hydrolyzing) [Candidatus Eisenbacteria bacterium]|nr:asparagine synthase (glutamine-hydrolyzing) [Candidatus Eisenbacteria bacterium]
MCGIAGYYSPSGRPVAPETLLRVSRMLRHRGPDDEGALLVDARGGRHFLAGPDTPADVRSSRLAYSPTGDLREAPPGPFPLALLHRRLSILDLSPGGHEPMCGPGGRHVVTFNGEIYNYLELRDELHALGREFRTGSDVEVLLHAYDQWGEACLARFNGMWSFALWDGRRLFCARDRLGIKPFYYAWDGERFVFSSEPKGVLAFGDLERRPDERALYYFLARDWTDFDTFTFFEGLTALLPAHALVVDERGPRAWRWWEVLPSPEPPPSEDEAVARLRELFGDAVSVHLRSDVPVGTCLSGGLDSSAVLSAASARLDHPMKAFSVGYSKFAGFDERPFAAEVARQAGAEFVPGEPDGSDLEDMLAKLAWYQDEPAAGMGIYSQWHVMRLAARDRVKVLLDGQGGDELFGGYHRYYWSALYDLFRRGRVAEWASLLRYVASDLGHGYPRTLARSFAPWLPPGLLVEGQRRFGQGKDRVLERAFEARRRDLGTDPPPRFGSLLNDQLYHDTTLRFLPSLLRYEDRNSMAWSIEARVPFLDHRVVEYAFRIPFDLKIRGHETKYVARRAFEPWVPQSVRARRDKMGYETPTDAWLRGEHARLLDELLLTGPCLGRGYLDAVELRAQVARFRAGAPLGLQVWRWLHLELWFRTFIDAPALEPAALPG